MKPWRRFQQGFPEAQNLFLPVPTAPLSSPYTCVLTPHDLAPRIVPGSPALAGLQLVFRVPLEKGAIVFTERPLIEDTVPEMPEEARVAQYNNRPAWSLVAQCFRLLTQEEINALLASGYAHGVVAAAQAWETPADDRALAHIMTRAPAYANEALVRRLYDVMATNNILACRTRMPLAGRQVELPLRYGFFPLLSRANHACTPSVTLAIPLFPLGPFHCSGGVSVVTTRAVQAGEAVTFDYVNNAPLEGKRETLLKLYGFRCACDTCVPLCAWLACDKRGTLACPCPAGSRTRYCSVEHQRADWPRHKTGEHR